MASCLDNFTTDRLALDYAVQTGEYAGVHYPTTGCWAYDGSYASGHRRTAETYSANHSAQAKYLAPGGGVWDWSVRVRCSATEHKYYAGGFDPNNWGNSYYRIWKWGTGGWGSVALSDPLLSPANGDVVKLEVNGTSLTLSVNGTPVPGCIAVTDTDLAVGQPGFGADAPGTTPIPLLDDFAASDGVVARSIAADGGSYGVTGSAATLSVTIGVVTDDFATSKIGTDWAAQTDEYAGDVSGGAWRITSASGCGLRRIREAWAGDHWSQATVKTITVSDIELRVRCQPTTRSYYAAGMDPNDFGGGAIYRIWKISNWVWTPLAVHASQTVAVNDVVRLTVSGSTLTLKVGNTDILTAVDGELTGGVPGFGGASATNPQAAFDDWSGGGATAPPPEPPPAGSGPNPMLLPNATTSQHPNATAYNALNVPGKSAGQSYADPVTGTKIYRITASGFPTNAAGGFAHDYSDGGAEISLPHTGTTRTVLVRDRATNEYWLIDFTPDVGVSNARMLPSALKPGHDICFTFSVNPATPYYAYVAQLNGVKRFNIITMTDAPGGGWPVTETGLDPCWLHQSKYDEFFVWMRGLNGPEIVGYEPSTQTKKIVSGAVDGNWFAVNPVNEPRIDREGRYVALTSGTNAGNGQPDQMVVWDWLNNVFTWKELHESPWGGADHIPFAHNASLRRRWAGVQWDGSWPGPFWKIDPSVPNSGALCTGQGAPTGNPLHCDGSWLQPDVADLDDQWFLQYYYPSGAGVIDPTEGYWLCPGGIMLLTLNGERRALCHPYATSVTYDRLAYGKLAPDGAYVIFNSDMNGQTRTDVFLAEIPQSSVTGDYTLAAAGGSYAVSGAIVGFGRTGKGLLSVAGGSYAVQGTTARLFRSLGGATARRLTLSKPFRVIKSVQVTIQGAVGETAVGARVMDYQANPGPHGGPLVETYDKDGNLVSAHVNAQIVGY